MVQSLGRLGIAYASGLTAIAGFVDGIAFVHFGGYFVSFMSGNSTRSSADFAQGNFIGWALAMGLVISFVFGVAAATLASRVASVQRRAAVLSTSTVLLLAAAFLALGSELDIYVAIFMAMSMGAVNATYTRHGEVSVGLTYMTGALVKIGQHLASALTGGSRWAWLPYAALWSMITMGSFLGALVYVNLGLLSLWIAAIAMVLWTAMAIYQDSPRQIFRTRN